MVRFINKYILSDRKIQQYPSWHIVYEWEEIISQQLSLKIVHANFLHRIYRGVVNRLVKYFGGHFFRFSLNPKKWRIVFIMQTRDAPKYCRAGNIPIFLDSSMDTIDEILKATKKIPFYWVTCKDFYNALTRKGASNVIFMPLSISDKYFCTYHCSTHKTIDVLQFGRKNEQLHEWMLNYQQKYPDI